MSASPELRETIAFIISPESSTSKLITGVFWYFSPGPVRIDPSVIVPWLAIINAHRARDYVRLDQNLTPRPRRFSVSVLLTLFRCPWFPRLATSARHGAPAVTL